MKRVDGGRIGVLYDLGNDEAGLVKLIRKVQASSTTKAGSLDGEWLDSDTRDSVMNDHGEQVPG